VNFVAALLAFLFGGWLPFVTAIACVMLVSIGFAGNTIYIMSALISTAMISFGTQKVHVRNKLYLPILSSALVGTVAVIIFNYTAFTPFKDMMRYAAEFAITTLFSPFLAFLALPLMEKISRTTSEFTLVNLADINSMLMQKLAVEAPGTFHHSIMVGNMASAAAEAIGANSTLARTGGYYHDIGKLVHPEYFDENQTGRNVHDSLTPFESYRTISSHTIEGAELGKLHGLPSPVIYIIEQHHGTTTVELFYR